MTDMAREIYRNLLGVETPEKSSGSVKDSSATELAKAYEAIREMEQIMDGSRAYMGFLPGKVVKDMLDKHEQVIKTAREQGE